MNDTTKTDQVQTDPAQAELSRVMEKALVLVPSGTPLERLDAALEKMAHPSAAILTAEQYTAAGDFLTGLQTAGKTIHATWDPEVEKRYRPYKASTDARKVLLDRKEKAERLVKGMVARYRREQLRLEEEERKRLQALVDAQHAAETAPKAEDPEAVAQELAMAIETGDMGALEKAPAPMLPTPAPVVTLPSAVPQLRGVGFAVVWKWRVTDAALIPAEYLVRDPAKLDGMGLAGRDGSRLIPRSWLVLSGADGPRSWLVLDVPRIDSQVKATKSATAIPGLEVYDADRVSAGATHG